MGDFIRGNEIRLLESGEAFFPALQAAIACAQHEVRLETYIFSSDATAAGVVRELMLAAKRGVKVHLVVDGFGSPRFAEEWGPMLRAVGVEFLVYRPEIARLRLRRHRLRRLHRKLACIDACVAFVGGINLIDDQPGEHLPAPRLDYAVEVRGALLPEVHGAMCRLWSLLRWAQLGRRYRPTPVQVACIAAQQDMRAAFLVRDNLRYRRDIEEAYLTAIAAAQSEVLIANAYFLPGRRFRHALMDAAQRGVRVTLLTQGRVEYPLQHYATQAGYAALLGVGVQIHEYRKSFLHAKVAVIDGHWATVGSSNIDPFSLLLAREANVVIDDAGFAAQLRQSLMQAITQDSVQVLPAQPRSLLMRVLGWLAYGTARALIGLAGYGRMY